MQFDVYAQIVRVQLKLIAWLERGVFLDIHAERRDGAVIGTVSDQQRPEADVNIEFPSRPEFAARAAELAWAFRDANEKYATDYPAQVGNHMTNTDSEMFQDLTPAISLRELERGAEMSAGWDPTHHQPTDVISHFSDGDFRPG